MKGSSIRTEAGRLQQKSFSDEDIRNAFKTFDIDKNMYIGAAEIRHVLSLLGETVSNEEVETMIGLCDSDGSGFVSYDGFHRLFASAQLSQVSNEDVSASASSRISARETKVNDAKTLPDLIARFGASQEINPQFIRNVYKRVQEIDKSHSGRLGYQEFLRALRCDDSEMMRKLFDFFDVSLMDEIDVRRFLICLIVHSKSIKFEEKFKISFSMMRSTKFPSDSLDRNSLKELISTFFTGERQTLSSLNIDERVDKIFESAKDGFLNFNDFMDIVETNADLVFPASLRR
jgi:Ca2+-binding EF-hand superfamily protein